MRVLLVDDDPEIRLIAGFILKDAGHDVIEAEDGAAAQSAWSEMRPDVILMDVVLGEDDGVEVAAALFRSTALQPLPRLIFLTAASQAAQLKRMQATNAAGVLHKPFDPATFLARFNELAGTA